MEVHLHMKRLLADPGCNTFSKRISDLNRLTFSRPPSVGRAVICATPRLSPSKACVSDGTVSIMFLIKTVKTYRDRWALLAADTGGTLSITACRSRRCQEAQQSLRTQEKKNPRDRLRGRDNITIKYGNNWTVTNCPTGSSCLTLAYFVAI